MSDFEVRGSKQLEKVARELKSAGDGKLRRKTLASIRTAAKPGIPAVRASAESTLPKRGGLADRVASQPYGIRTSLAAGKVSIVGKGMKELELIDSGTVRHPTFAHRRSLFSGNTRGAGLMIGRRSGEWHSQKVTPGFFSKPLTRLGPGIRKAVLKAIADIQRSL